MTIWGVGMSLVKADLLVGFVNRLQPDITTDEDVTSVLGLLRLAFLTYQDHSDDRTCFTRRRAALLLVTPVVIRALKSTSRDVSGAAHLFLGRVGSTSWSKWYEFAGHGHYRHLSLATEPALGSLIITGLGDCFKHATTSNLSGLTRWLVASTRLVPSLALSFTGSDIVSLFVNDIKALQQQSAPDEWRRSMMFDLTFLFLTTWDTTFSPTLPADMVKEASGLDRTFATSDEAFDTLMRYILEEGPALRRDSYTVLELVQHAYAFIEYAFLFRPTAALSFNLDVACDLLLEHTAGWRSNPRRGDRVEDMGLLRGRAKRAHTNMREPRDMTGSGWWKFGGLGKACIEYALG
ncbi:hypothetical protein FRB93_007919 [Tulasnella sp. JGI-2019a]|nr:hypothetical protein FRB93_007919 [Tulasnella sp. JGI-2019a]